MKQKLRILLFALPLFVMNPALSQSKELVKAIMTNHWVSKYKKLKSDLENKVAFLKNMEGISEENLRIMKKSYLTTQSRLDLWIDHLSESVATGSPESRELLAQGDLTDPLKTELHAVFSFYANDFVTKFEDITGQNAVYVIDNGPASAVGSPVSPGILTEKIDKATLLAQIRNSLEPLSWASIY